MKRIGCTILLLLAGVRGILAEDPFPHPDCPPNEDPADPTHLPYPNDCTKFYKCLYGYAYPMDCPPGLHWSVEFDRCEYPSIAKCEDGQKPKSKTAKPTTKPQPYEEPIKHSDCPPNENPANPTHLRYPNDCTKFYKCLHGYAYPMNCPPSLHWSVKLNRCDYPNVAQCEDGQKSTEKPKVTTSGPATPTPEGPIKHPSCPPNENPANPTHLPYPHDCSKFYKCLYGYAYPIDCPSGLHWSVKLNRCDYPNIAQCTDGEGPVEKPTENPPTPEGPIKHPSCPPNENPANPTHLPYPHDCSKFYKCLEGYAYPLDCPSGLHWSVKLDRCDYPNIAQCTDGEGPTGKPTDNPPTSKPAFPAGTSCSKFGAELLPHSSDCRKYIQCANGVPFERDCPAGLHWQTGANTCNYPEYAGCVL